MYSHTMTNKKIFYPTFLYWSYMFPCEGCATKRLICWLAAAMESSEEMSLVGWGLGGYLLGRDTGFLWGGITGGLWGAALGMETMGLWGDVLVTETNEGDDGALFELICWFCGCWK